MLPVLFLPVITDVNSSCTFFMHCGCLKSNNKVHRSWLAVVVEPANNMSAMSAAKSSSDKLFESRNST